MGLRAKSDNVPRALDLLHGRRCRKPVVHEYRQRIRAVLRRPCRVRRALAPRAHIVRCNASRLPAALAASAPASAARAAAASTAATATVATSHPSSVESTAADDASATIAARGSVQQGGRQPLLACRPAVL